MGGGVAVAAHQCRAGKRQPLFGPHHVHDALAVLAEVEQLDAVGAGRLAHRLDQRQARRMGMFRAAGPGRHGVIGRAVDQARLHRRIAFIDGFLQRLAPRHVVQQQAIDVQEHEAVAEICDDVAVPDLVEQGLAHGFGLWVLGVSAGGGYQHPASRAASPSRSSSRSSSADAYHGDIPSLGPQSQSAIRGSRIEVGMPSAAAA